MSVNTDRIAADWIAVDWGTTRLRAFAMTGNSVAARAQSDDGMGGLGADQFEAALLALIEPWLPADRSTDIIACGMVGARQGWSEAPYAKVPCAPLPDRLHQVATQDPRLRVRIVPGLSQASPPDVMRGEETQIAGFLALNPGWDGVICLPGSHTKWAHLSAGEVVSFQTTMTGELLAALSAHTVLRHSVAADGWDEAVFLEALDHTRTRPETLAARLFRLRAADLLEGTDPVVTRSMLAGLLIGADLAAAKPYWLGQPVAVIGASAPARAYVSGLQAQGLSPIQADVDAMTRAGLSAAYQQTKES